MSLPRSCSTPSRRTAAAFRPGVLDEPYVIVSVDVLAADSSDEALRLAAGYPRWVHSIRAGQGAIPFPSPERALANPLDHAALAVVRDRVATQFTGSADVVAERLETLRRVTGADELLITSITHDPADRERSYELLAAVWGLEARSAVGAGGAGADANADSAAKAEVGANADPGARSESRVPQSPERTQSPGSARRWSSHDRACSVARERNPHHPPRAA